MILYLVHSSSKLMYISFSQLFHVQRKNSGSAVSPYYIFFLSVFFVLFLSFLTLNGIISVSMT